MQRLENIPGHETAAEVLAPYLHAQAGEFLRSLRLHREAGPDNHSTEEAARALRAAARRISATLHTFRPLLDAPWADQLRAELAWLSGTLAGEHALTARLTRLLDSLHRLSGNQVPPPRGESGSLTVGAARAGALLDRQLTLARTRAHSAALQALGSSRFHAVADAVALLASEVPLASAAAAHAAEVLAPAALDAEDRLERAVAVLPLARAARPYNAEALVQASESQDSPWHQVRLLLRLYRYAQEVLHHGLGATVPTERLAAAGCALDRHRDAAEAASAASAAARTPRIAPATAYALGVLHADQRHEVEAARFAFQRVWQPVAVTSAPSATTAAP
ncbi:CHAD domain-containing protein [Streptomyces sp. NBC_01431]|uniref:CHAD domain-containing protein n=1 Tax=Streptomyces sp. NBC_01431 TaxID=2903863 RepID=UPI002E37FD1F|nr:CHAD domain-containing protein [Streptomyces sp. NBC_01431]